MTRKYTRKSYSPEQIADAVKGSVTMVEVMAKLGMRLTGGSHANLSRRIKGLGLDTSHFLGKSVNKGKAPSNKKTAKEILVLRSGNARAKTPALRRAMLESGVGHVCSGCGNEGEWMGRALVLHIDHINENWLDDRLGNLRFLCPNCHATRD